MAAKAVTESLTNLLSKLKENQSVGDTSRSEEAYQAVLAAAESLLDASASPQELLKRAKHLAEVRNYLCYCCFVGVCGVLHCMSSDFKYAHSSIPLLFTLSFCCTLLCTYVYTYVWICCSEKLLIKDTPR